MGIIRPCLAAGLTALMVVLVNGLLPSAAGGLEPDCEVENPPPACEPEPDLPPSGPIGRDVQLYDSRQTALPAVHAVLDEVLDHTEPGTRAPFAGEVVRVHVIPRDRHLTDLPLWSHLRGEKVDNDPNDTWNYPNLTWDDTRGSGDPDGCGGATLNVAVGEEQMTQISGGVEESPDPQEFGLILAHEVGHVIRCEGLSQAQRTSLTAVHDAAERRFRNNDVDSIVGDDPSYTVRNDDEFFAEATAAWFNMGGPDSTYRRQWLRGHDGALYDLLDEVFTSSPAPLYCEGARATTVIRSGGGRFTGTFADGQDVIVGSSAQDFIDSASGADLICGEGGDDGLTGGYGDDRIHGGAGDDVLRGGPNDDNLHGGLGRDLSYGDSGEDLLDDDFAGNTDTDIPPEPGDGNDRLYGGPGDDDLWGGVGNDYLNDTSGQDELTGGDGSDRFWSIDDDGALFDWLFGNAGVDFCSHDPNDLVTSCAPPLQPQPPLPTDDPPENSP